MRSEEGSSSRRGPPRRRILAFRQDEEAHWVAVLECGHSQHVRHDPPLVERPWVLTEEGRSARLGAPLPCVRCLEEMGET